MTRLFSFIFCLLSTLTIPAQTFKLTDTVFNAGDTFIAEKIYFNFNEYNIRIESYPLLDSIADFLKKNNKLILEIGGYVNVRGSIKYEIDLGTSRAKAVKKYLVKSGVKSKTLKPMGYSCRDICNYNPDYDTYREQQTEEQLKCIEMSRYIKLKVLKVD